MHNIKTLATTVAAAALVVSFGATASPLVDVDWVKQRLGDANVKVVDLRKAEDYASGHIPGSVNAPYGEFGWRETVDGVIGMLPPLDSINTRIGSLGIEPATHVVIIPYGDSSTDVGSAARVYWTFKVLGHDKVSLLDGGLRSWKAQDEYTLRTVPTTPTPAGPYPGQVDEKLVIDTATLLEKVKSGEVQPIDARTDEQWEGKKKHPKARIPGAVPEASRLPQAELVDAGTGKFVSPAKVVEVAEAYGWNPSGSTPFVSYCNTGHWAATAWFALSEVADIDDVSLYDGSMVAWTQDESNPLINSPGKLQQVLDNLTSQN